ncbi:MAG: hypothetical protein AAF560_11815 [Acidobacteriota bacterium]
MTHSNPNDRSSTDVSQSKPHQAPATAIEDCVGRLKRRNVLKLFGTLDWDPEYDYKIERQER